MSNKEIFDNDEVIERQNNHLNRTLKELGWIQIKLGDYERLKINYPNNFHNYTAIIRNEYFKLNLDKYDIEVYLDLTKSKFKSDKSWSDVSDVDDEIKILNKKGLGIRKTRFI